MSIRTRRLWAAFLLLAAMNAGAAPPAKSAQPPLQHFFVSGSAGGILEMRAPADWTRVGPATPIDMRFTRAGSRDNLRLTAYPMAKEQQTLLTDEKLRDTLQANGAKIRQGSVEQKLDLQPLKLPDGRGYYFSVTDKAQVGKPDSLTSFRYLHSGMVQFGTWLAVFNIVSNDKDNAFVQEALAAVSSLRWADAAVDAQVAAKGLERIHLAGTPAVAQWKSKKELACQSSQAVSLYEKFNDLYGAMLPVRTVKTAFETFDAGKGDEGSVLYFEFDAPLRADARAFIAGLLWGDQMPRPGRAEEFYAAGKYLVVWCTRTESAIKHASQARLESLIFGGK